MTYVSHSLRRLENIGREGPILKELNQLPTDTTALYELLLRDCTRNRSKSEMAVLKKLFAWIAYAKTLISMPILNKIIEDSAGQSFINVDEELGYRSARYLTHYTHGCTQFI